MSIKSDLKEYIEELKNISYLYHIIKRLEKIIEDNKWGSLKLVIIGMSIESDLKEYIEELKNISYLYHIIKRLEKIIEDNK